MCYWRRRNRPIICVRRFFRISRSEFFEPFFFFPSFLSQITLDEKERRNEQERLVDSFFSRRSSVVACVDLRIPRIRRKDRKPSLQQSSFERNTPRIIFLPWSRVANISLLLPHTHVDAFRWHLALASEPDGTVDRAIQ